MTPRLSLRIAIVGLLTACDPTPDPDPEGTLSTCITCGTSGSSSSSSTGPELTASTGSESTSTGGTATTDASTSSSGESSTGTPEPMDADDDGVFTPEDCDDTDPRAFPGQTEFFDTPRLGAGGFDFDCDENETLEAPDFAECDPPVCGSAPGWSRLYDVIPGCGETAYWDDGYCQVESPPDGPGYCSGPGGPPSLRTQACR